MWNWFWVVAMVLVRTDGARFLAFFPWPMRSHFKTFEPLLQELALRGHHVTVYTPFPSEQVLPNYTQVTIPDTSPLIMETIGEEVFKAMNKYPSIRAFIAPFSMRLFNVKSVEVIMKTGLFKDLINSDLQFDALILESGFASEPYLALKHRFKTINIEVLSTCNVVWANWIFGTPYDPSFIADFSLPYTDQMGLWERVHSELISLSLRVIGSSFMSWYQTLTDEYVRYPGWEERPSLWEMLADTALILSNCHIATNYPIPLSPNFKEVGGINISPYKRLPEDLLEFMDSADEGVIYFSMGSFASPRWVVGDFVQQEFVKAFGGLKQKVLWKWDDEIADLPENVRLERWFPQQSILGHKNLRLFITHGGLLSSIEAIYEGVPLIGIPIFGDQLSNVRHMEHFGYGLFLSLHNLSYTTISQSINQVLNNPRYKEKAVERQRLLRDELYTPLEKAVYWTEYVVRHRGAPHLQPAVGRLPWYQEALVDVYLILALIILVPLYLFYRTSRYALSRCFSTRISNPTETTSKPLEKKLQ